MATRESIDALNKVCSALTLETPLRVQELNESAIARLERGAAHAGVDVKKEISILRSNLIPH